MLIPISIYVRIFVSEVFANSPFFISAEVAGALEGRSDASFSKNLTLLLYFHIKTFVSFFLYRNNDDYKEISVPAGKTHEVCLHICL